jgi:3-deoxy-7-phosphoheptulonate synthase
MNELDMQAYTVTPLPTPAQLTEDHPLTDEAERMIADARQQIIDVLEGRDKRMIVIVGPCSEDDSVQSDGTPSVVRYASELKKLAGEPDIKEKLLLIMRCPPAKPRSDLGLAGLEQKDVVVAHRLLTDIANLGLPLAIEVMEPEHIARYGRLICLPWVGARNNRDTMLRHALSAYSDFPILIKNDERGDLKPALQAIDTIGEGHDNARITLPDGRTGYVGRTAGSSHTGLIWRGGTEYMSAEKFEEGLQKVAKTKRPYAIDCAHANEQAHDPEHGKSVAGQKACFDHVLQLLAQDGLATSPKALMIESHILEGQDTSQQTPGKSWTDPCVSLEDAKEMIRHLASVAS